MTDAATREWRPKVNPFVIAGVVTIPVFMEILDTTIVNVALPHIAGGMAVSAEESTWVATSYLVANAIVLSVSGALSAFVGRRRFFLICVGMFTLASLLCGLATSLPELIVFRLFQGLAGGGMVPSQQAILLDTFTLKQRGQAFALAGMATIAAPILGPTLGGIITDGYSWRWVFLMNVPIGGAAIFLAAAVLEDPPHFVRRRFTGWGSLDLPGLALAALCLGSLQVILDIGQKADWLDSPWVRLFALISLATFVAGVFWMLAQEHPLIELRLFRDRNFAVGCTMIFMTGFGLFGTSVIMPIMTQTLYGYTATLSGYVLSPGAIMIVFMMPFIANVAVRVQPKYLAPIGYLGCGFGVLSATYLLTPGADFWTLLILRCYQVIGLGFLFVSSSQICYSNVPPGKNDVASSLFSLARNMGGSVGIATATTIYSRGQQSHQATLTQHLSALDPNVQLAISERVSALTARGVPLAEAQQSALGQLNRVLFTQSAMLAFLDVFLVLGLALVLTAWLPLITRPIKRASNAPAPEILEA